jgi:hypothetical protein
MPEKSLIETTVEGPIQTCLYQAQLLHKEFAQPLNIVIIVKSNLHTQAQAHVILFSSDLTLAAAVIFKRAVQQRRIGFPKTCVVPNKPSEFFNPTYII